MGYIYIARTVNKFPAVPPNLSVSLPANSPHITLFA